MSQETFPHIEPAPEEPSAPSGATPASPGTGPKGETCGTCAHAYRRQGGRCFHWKCDLVQATGGPGTDIRLKTPACRFWEEKAHDG